MKSLLDGWSKKPQEVKTIIVIGCMTAFLLSFVGLAGLTGLISYSNGFSFISGLVAGILGILIGFSLDRLKDMNQEEKTKQTSLKLILNELTELQKKADGKHFNEFCILRLHTDMWDSVVSSGNLCLLDYDQIVKLSQVYNHIRSPNMSFEVQTLVANEIDEILKEKWWNLANAKT